MVRYGRYTITLQVLENSAYLSMKGVLKRDPASNGNGQLPHPI